MTERVVAYCRVSTEQQSQGDKVSLSTQQERINKYCNDNNYTVSKFFTETYSGLSLDRPKLNELREMVRNHQVDVVVVYCVDRLSRDPAHGVIITQEFEKHKVTLKSATEAIDDSELGRLINYIRGYSSKVEVEKIKDRTMRAKYAYAKSGKLIPNGFGRFGGYLGLCYDKKKKMLLHVDGDIKIANEILLRAIDGQSSCRIAKDLQERNVKGLAGRLIHRSSVSNVLSKAKVYAGVVVWKGIEIRNFVDRPVITEAQAAIIEERLKLNKIRSYSAPKKMKWLTHRVFCAKCGRSYSLGSLNECHCNGSDARIPAYHCAAPKMMFRDLSAVTYGTMIEALSNPELVIAKASKTHAEWQEHQKLVHDIESRRTAQKALYQKRRENISRQHEMGTLTDMELVQRLAEISKEESDIELTSINIPAEPPTAEIVVNSINRLKLYKPLRQHFAEVLANPHDPYASQLADEVGLKVIIDEPKVAGQKYSIRVAMNLPIIEPEKLDTTPPVVTAEQRRSIASLENDICQSTVCQSF